MDFGLSKMAGSENEFKKSEADFEKAVRRSRKNIQRRMDRRDRLKNIESSSDSEYERPSKGNPSFRPIAKGEKLYSPVGTCRLDNFLIH